ncbi:MAG: ribosome-associated translation inhibitor RaiA [Chloroflexota bacterium]|nr:MAG: ribosome-associated translation inhibitor RaiA [Chloroflexota bacterium]
MALEVNIFSRNIDVSDNLREQIEKKVSGLDRYFDDITEARVDLSQTNARNLDEREAVQITVQGKGFILRAEERSSDIVSSLNLALDTLQKRIRRYKGKRNQRWKQATVPDDISLKEDEDWEEIPVIARRKKFPLRPMDEWEAIEQMELLGHTNFFVFYNAQTESINVLYRRYDGSLGLIQPVIG